MPLHVNFVQCCSLYFVGNDATGELKKRLENHRAIIFVIGWNSKGDFSLPVAVVTKLLFGTLIHGSLSMKLHCIQVQVDSVVKDRLVLCFGNPSIQPCSYYLFLQNNCLRLRGGMILLLRQSQSRKFMFSTLENLSQSKLFLDIRFQ